MGSSEFECIPKKVKSLNSARRPLSISSWLAEQGHLAERKTMTVALFSDANEWCTFFLLRTSVPESSEGSDAEKTESE